MPDWKQEIRRRLADLNLEPMREAAIVEELAAHLDDCYEESLTSGATPAEAERRTLEEVRGCEKLQRELLRVERPVNDEPVVLGAGRKNMIAELWQDLRYAARGLRKHAVLSTVVIATLTLGIGISAGMFTYINASFLRAHVDKDHGSFVRIYSAYTKDPARPGRPGRTTLEDYLAFRDRARSLHNVTAWAQFEAPLGQDDPSEVRALLVTCNFFSLYDPGQPRLGRLLQPEDCSASNPVVVLSEGLWRNRFAADPQIVGKVVHFNGQPVTVVGVTPRFAGQLESANAWFPYTLETYLKRGEDSLKPGEVAWLMVEGRLNPGFSHRDAAAELALLADQQDRLRPGRKTKLTITDGSIIQDPEFGDNVTWLVSLITGVLTFLVLITCANVTTLLLARADRRQQEIAIRLALGAGRLRLVRMLMTETLLLASIAGLLSLCFAYRFPDLLLRMLSDPLHDITEHWSLIPDWRVFTYLTAITLLAGMMAGLAPARQSLSVNMTESLKGRRSLFGGANGGARLRGLLIGAQVALSFVLLIGAAIFVRSYQKMSTFAPGFETRQVLSALLLSRSQSTAPRSQSNFHHTLAQRLETLPGVQSVAFANRLPFYNATMFDVQVPNQPARRVAVNWVSPNFFTTLGIPIMSGRALNESDPPCGKSGCSVIVSEELVRQFWPSADPLGKELRDPRGTCFEVVGVARNISTQRLGGLDDPMVYLPWIPNVSPNHYAPLVRFTGDGEALSRAVTATIRKMSPEITVEARTIQSWMDEGLAYLWKLEVMVTLLGAVAAALAVMGIYGVVSFTVSRRTKELGIRIALGAQKRDIYSTVLGASARPIIAGLLIGLLLTLAGATALARVLQRARFTVNVYDPITYTIAAVLLVAVALVAMLGPARRATRVDPMLALRDE